MAQAFHEAARYRQTDPPRKKGASLKQWPNVQTDRNGNAGAGTAPASYLSNEEIIHRIERTATIADIENLESQRQLDEVIVSSFIESYLRPLAAATKEAVTRRENGVFVLPRRSFTENALYVTAITYGYHPAEVAFALKQLYELLTNARQGVDHKELRLSNDLLLGFSCVLGYYNLCCYLLQELRVKEEILWLQKLCDLSVSYSALESGMDSAKSWLVKYMPPYNASAPDIPCWLTYGDTRYSGSEISAANSIISAEKRRLLAFRKSLYMYLNVLASHTD